jgi:hypothetical protein
VCFSGGGRIPSPDFINMKKENKTIDALKNAMEFCERHGADKLSSLIKLWNNGSMCNSEFVEYVIDNVCKHVGVSKNCILTKYSQHEYKKYAVGLIVLYLFENTSMMFSSISRHLGGISRSVLYNNKNLLNSLSSSVPTEKYIIEKKEILDKIIKQYLLPHDIVWKMF